MMISYTSSDSSDDEQNMAQLREAADAQFISDDMFARSKNNTKTKGKSSIRNGSTETKSQRYIADENEHHNDLKITHSMQEHIAKKLSEMISNQIRFKDFTSTETCMTEKNEDVSGIRLLSNSKYLLTAELPKETFTKQYKPNIKRRKVDTTLCSEDEEVKCKLVSVSPDKILLKCDTEKWSNRSKAELFCYKMAKDGKLNLVEPKNEFTEMRNKNNWSESKISGQPSKKKKQKSNQAEEGSCRLPINEIGQNSNAWWGKSSNI